MGDEETREGAAAPDPSPSKPQAPVEANDDAEVPADVIPSEIEPHPVPQSDDPHAVPEPDLEGLSQVPTKDSGGATSNAPSSFSIDLSVRIVPSRLPLLGLERP